VILIADREAPDRDAIAAGVSLMPQLAGALASSGFVAVRYDNRSTGQSGGRAESATLTDYAEDARAVVKWLESRKDIDTRRIAVVGYDEGAWMALIAASREKRIEAIVTLAGPAANGQELILEQQRLQLDEMKIDAEDRAKREALQKQIHAAVITGKGWDQLPPEIRRRADTPWFRSLLVYDPATVTDDIDAPMLIVHGELDQEVPVAHAERLAALANKGGSPSVALVTVRGVNHLLIPAFTGKVAEYATLADRVVSKDVTTAVVDWLTKTLPAQSKR
jgi:dipeptidyl aminopeptidase/acylaminoacyl peptidase